MAGQTTEQVSRVSAILHSTSGDHPAERYAEVRQRSLELCSPLEVEDYQVQPMDDASPPKWHLAHVTWFFETFLLKPFLPDYRIYHDAFETLFNSYYNGVGQPFTRAHRGFLSRPTLQQVLEYRRYVDEAMLRLMSGELSPEILLRIEVGFHHERQHQELLLTDLKYNLGNNPLKPVYQLRESEPCAGFERSWLDFEGGVIEAGADGTGNFVFDNETPRHQVYLAPFSMASHPVSNADYIDFIEDGGYDRADLWLSDGWAHLQSLGDGRWEMPLYWCKRDSAYFEYTLAGEQPVDPWQPVCHVSGYEADAFARWSGHRLPTETEWELAAADLPVAGNFADNGVFHPEQQQAAGISGMFGDVWEWTSSAYGPYPGYQPFEGQLGEYNGKFMANQLVLRGGSCASAADHIRATYRNFFYPPDRWQFTGIRLARNLNAD